MKALKALVDKFKRAPETDKANANLAPLYESYCNLLLCRRGLLAQGKAMDPIEIIEPLFFQATYAKITGGDLALDLNQEERTFLGEEWVAAYESHKKDMGFCDGLQPHEVKNKGRAE